jgi:hypothetical protein
MVMGVRTEVSIARALDKGDLDPVYVHPLPIQQKILDAFGQLGFRFKSADIEVGQIYGVHQTLPFYQEIEYWPAPQYAHAINELELTFVTSPHSVEVVLEFDKRGGMFSAGRDSYGRYSVPHADADTTDWAQVVDGWVREAVTQHQSYGAPAYGGGYGHGGHGHGHGGHGPGIRFQNRRLAGSEFGQVHDIRRRVGAAHRVHVARREGGVAHHRKRLGRLAVAPFLRGKIVRQSGCRDLGDGRLALPATQGYEGRRHRRSAGEDVGE